MCVCPPARHIRASLTKISFYELWHGFGSFGSLNKIVDNVKKQTQLPAGHRPEFRSDSKNGMAVSFNGLRKICSRTSPSAPEQQQRDSCQRKLSAKPISMLLYKNIGPALERMPEFLAKRSEPPPHQTKVEKIVKQNVHVASDPSLHACNRRCHQKADPCSLVVAFFLRMV